MLDRLMQKQHVTLKWPNHGTLTARDTPKPLPWRFELFPEKIF